MGGVYIYMEELVAGDEADLTSDDLFNTIFFGDEEKATPIKESPPESAHPKASTTQKKQKKESPPDCECAFAGAFACEACCKKYPYPKASPAFVNLPGPFGTQIQRRLTGGNPS